MTVFNGLDGQTGAMVALAESQRSPSDRKTRITALGAHARDASAGDPSRDMVQMRATPDASPAQRIEQRLREADLLMRAGEFDACLKVLLNVYDFHRHELTGSSHWLRVLLTRIAQLGEQYAPAFEALHSRRDRLESLVVEGIGDRSAVTEFHAINRALSETDRTVELFRTLEALGPKQRQLQADLAVVVLEHLIDQRRYAAALEHEQSFRSRLQDLFANYRMLQQQSEPLLGIDGLLPAGTRSSPRGQNDAEPPEEVAPHFDSPIEQVRNRALHLASLYFEALIGIGDMAVVEDFVDELDHVFSRDVLRPRLTRHVLRANPDAASIILDRLGIAHDG